MNYREVRMYELMIDDGYSRERAREVLTTLARGHQAGIRVCWQDEELPWDGDCEPPRYHLHGMAKRGEEILATLGSVGVESVNDPYLIECEASLIEEAFEVLNGENQRAADALAERATYAAG